MNSFNKSALKQKASSNSNYTNNPTSQSENYRPANSWISEKSLLIDMRAQPYKNVEQINAAMGFLENNLTTFTALAILHHEHHEWPICEINRQSLGFLRMLYRLSHGLKNYVLSHDNPKVDDSNSLESITLELMEICLRFKAYYDLTKIENPCQQNTKDDLTHGIFIILVEHWLTLFEVSKSRFERYLSSGEQPMYYHMCAVNFSYYLKALINLAKFSEQKNLITTHEFLDSARLIMQKRLFPIFEAYLSSCQSDVTDQATMECLSQCHFLMGSICELEYHAKGFEQTVLASGACQMMLKSLNEFCLKYLPEALTNRLKTIDLMAKKGQSQLQQVIQNINSLCVQNSENEFEQFALVAKNGFQTFSIFLQEFSLLFPDTNITKPNLLQLIKKIEQANQQVNDVKQQIAKLIGASEKPREKDFSIEQQAVLAELDNTLLTLQFQIHSLQVLSHQQRYSILEREVCRQNPLYFTKLHVCALAQLAVFGQLSTLLLEMQSRSNTAANKPFNEDDIFLRVNCLIYNNIRLLLNALLMMAQKMDHHPLPVQTALIKAQAPLQQLLEMKNISEKGKKIINDILHDFGTLIPNSPAFIPLLTAKRKVSKVKGDARSCLMYELDLSTIECETQQKYSDFFDQFKCLDTLTEQMHELIDKIPDAYYKASLNNANNNDSLRDVTQLRSLEDLHCENIDHLSKLNNIYNIKQDVLINQIAVVNQHDNVRYLGSYLAQYYEQVLALRNLVEGLCHFYRNYYTDTKTKSTSSQLASAPDTYLKYFNACIDGLMIKTYDVYPKTYCLLQILKTVAKQLHVGESAVYAVEQVQNLKRLLCLSHYGRYIKLSDEMISLIKSTLTTVAKASKKIPRTQQNKNRLAKMNKLLCMDVAEIYARISIEDQCVMIDNPQQLKSMLRASEFLPKDVTKTANAKKETAAPVVHERVRLTQTCFGFRPLADDYQKLKDANPLLVKTLSKINDTQQILYTSILSMSKKKKKQELNRLGNKITQYAIEMCELEKSFQTQPLSTHISQPCVYFETPTNDNNDLSAKELLEHELTSVWLLAHLNRMTLSLHLADEQAIKYYFEAFATIEKSLDPMAFQQTLVVSLKGLFLSHMPVDVYKYECAKTFAAQYFIDWMAALKQSDLKPQLKQQGLDISDAGNILRYAKGFLTKECLQSQHAKIQDNVNLLSKLLDMNKPKKTKAKPKHKSSAKSNKTKHQKPKNNQSNNQSKSEKKKTKSNNQNLKHQVHSQSPRYNANASVTTTVEPDQESNPLSSLSNNNEHTLEKKKSYSKPTRILSLSAPPIARADYLCSGENYNTFLNSHCPNEERRYRHPGLNKDLQRHIDNEMVKQYNSPQHYGQLFTPTTKNLSFIKKKTSNRTQTPQIPR